MSRKIARELAFKVIFSVDFQHENEDVEKLIMKYCPWIMGKF